MRELIKIDNKEINNELIQTVNARELHSFLGVGRKFNTWIKSRIEQYEFVENQDFICISQNRETQRENNQRGVSVSLEYFITLDMAKELAMVERNDKGREARRYFIECEKQLLSKPILTPKQSCFLSIIEASSQEELLAGLNKLNSEVITPLENKVEQQEVQLELNKPKVSYHDIILNCPDLVTITQIANDYPISNRALNKILEESGVQYKDKSGVWILRAAYNSHQYAQTSTHVYIGADGKNHAKLHLKWTQKGRLFIYDLLKSKGILPICEQED